MKVWSVPRPLAAMWSHSIEPQAPHIGRGGWRSFAQPLQRWIGIVPFATASHHQALSWPMGGLMRPGFCGCAAAAPSLAAGRGWLGMNFSTRKVSQPTSSPLWSL